MEASNLSAFRVMIIKILNIMKKGIGTIKKDQSETKNAISKIGNALEGINMKQRMEPVIQKTR